MKIQINRSSSTRQLLSYNDEQYQPENFQQIVTYSLDHTSQSLFADIPDSNYTKFSSINPRYNGSELQSLDYNHFTPSGTIGQPPNLPVQPYNRKAKGQRTIQTSVALAFLNGSTSSQETGLAAWEGDNSYGKSAVIDKNPMYIAHFQDSFEQYNLWDSTQFNIDSLILIPTESIQGKQGYTPEPLLVDGNNQNKKIVSSTFEPNRKVAVSYDALNTAKLNFSTQQSKDGFGKSYTLGGGAVKFLTINSNEKSRTTNAVSWSYSYKKAISASRQGSQILENTQRVTQMVTSSTDMNVFTNINQGSGYVVGNAFQTQTSGNGSNMTINILEVGPNGEVLEFEKLNHGSGYAIGDIVEIKYGLNTSANFTFNKKAIKGLLLSGSYSNILYSNIGNLAKAPNSLSQYFQLYNAPQLVNFHTYNFAIENQYFANGSLGSCPTDPRNAFFTGGNGRPFWINRGQDPSDPENYFKWNPSGSGMREYEDSDTPYTIQRGDVVRVEGFKQQYFKGGTTASIDFKEDFTVMDVIDYYYSSSAQLLALNVGNFNGPDPLQTNGQLYTTINAQGMGTTLMAGNISANTAGTITAAIGTGGAIGTFTSDGSTLVEAFVSVSGSTGTYDYPGNAFPPTFANYAVGQTHTVNLSAIGGPANATIRIGKQNMKNRYSTETGVSTLFSDTGSDNPFQIGANDSCGSGGQLFSTAGYYPITLPSFLVTDRDPEVVLDGLDGGSIKRFTIRRQIEDDSAVMVINIEPPTLQSTTSPVTYSGILRVDTVIGSNFIETNTTTGMSNTAGVTIDILPTMTDGNGLGGKMTIKIQGNTVTQVKFTEVAESQGYTSGDSIELTAAQIGQGGSGVFKGFLTFKNILENRIDKTVGVSALSSQGFLIPNDLSLVQKENALSIINEMRSKNSFPQDIANAGNGASQPFSGIDVDDPNGF